MVKNKINVLVAILSILFLCVACSTGDAVEPGKNETPGNESAENDPTNNEEKSGEDHRIVATTVAITEFMAALDIDLVGVPTTYKELPEQYANATEVGNPMGPDMEVVLSLKPTHVLSVTNLEGDLRAPFEQHNIPASFLDLDTVDGMFAEISKLGEQYNRTAQAKQLIDDFSDKMIDIESQVSDKESPKVLILMGIPGSYIVGTEHSYIGDLVERAGGVNVVEDRMEDYISANTEYLQQLEPDIILRAAHGAPTEVVKMFDKEFKENDIWKHFQAVQNERVYDLEETLFGTTANLAANEALDELIELLYPES